MLLRLIFDRDIHMDVFPQLIIADVACIHPFPALPDTGFKIQGFSVFLFHIPFQVPENTRAVPFLTGAQVEMLIRELKKKHV